MGHSFIPRGPAKPVGDSGRALHSTNEDLFAGTPRGSEAPYLIGFSRLFMNKTML